MTDNNKTVRVLSFSPSADAELNRWALFYYGIPFKEERHAPPFYFLLNFLYGGKSLVLCRDGEKKLTNVRAIIDHFDAQIDPAMKLMPELHSNELDAHWRRFNSELGNAVVKWAYSNLLPYKNTMIRPLTLGSPWFERFFVKHWYNLPKNLIWKSQKLGKAEADRALQTITKIFSEVDQLLADGRRYLCGNQLTLADLAFAVSGAPLVLPANYGGDQFDHGPLPSFTEFPEELQQIINNMRQTHSGKFILQLYAEERYRTLHDSP